MRLLIRSLQLLPGIHGRELRHTDDVSVDRWVDEEVNDIHKKDAMRSHGWYLSNYNER